jgi:fibronectin-binding autotransporter adhesin
MMISALVARRFLVLVAAFAILVFAPCAYAANDLWVGNTSANWADLNWSSGNNPPLTGDALLFGAAGSSGTTLNNNLAVNTTVNGLTYNTGGAGFITNGNQIFLVSNITNNSTALQTLNLPILTTRTATVTMTAAGGNVMIAGVVSGGGGFTTAGTGTLTLTAANTITGGTTGAANTVIALGNNNALQYSTVTLNSTTANSLMFASGVTAANIGSLASAAGAGNITLSDGTNPVTLTAGINNSAQTYNGAMSGSGGFVKVGTATQTFAGANLYSGATAVNNGTLAITGTGLTSTSLQLGGGTLQVNNAAAALNFTGGTTLNGGASGITDTAGSAALGAITRNVGSTLNLTLTVSNVTSSTGTASTILTDAGAAYATVGQDWAAKNAGNTNIVGLSTIAGGYTNTTASALSGNADVAAGVDTTLGGDATITSLRFNQAQARTINLGSSTLTTGGILNTTTVAGNASIITGGTVKGAAGKDLVVIQNNTSTGGTLTIGSLIADNGGATGLTKAGGGTLVLTGANSYTGTTRVNAGSLQFSTLANLGTGPIVLNGGTLQYATGSTVDLSTRSLTFTPGNGSLGGSIDTNGNNVTFANVIGTGSTGSFIKTGAGTLTLNAANAVNTGNNPFIGTQVSGGVLQLGNANTVQNGTLIVAVNNGLAFSSGIGTFNIGALAGGNNFALTDTAAAPVTISVGANNLPTSYNGNLSGAGSVVKTGTGVLSLGGAGGTFTGNVTINSGVLNTGTGGSPNNSVFGNPLAPGRSLTINSDATMQWTSNNIFGNGIGVNVANLMPIVVNNGGTFFSNRYNFLPNITLNGGTLTQAVSDGPGTFEGFTFRGNVTVGGSTPSIISANLPVGQLNLKGDHLAFNTNFNVADATGNANADLIVSAPLADQSGDFGGGVGGFTKTGTGTMLINGLNVYSGDTTVAQGTLALGGVSAPLTATTGTYTTTNGVITGIPSTAGLVVGQPVSGTNIPARARIQSIDSATQVTISNNPTLAGTAAAITFGNAGALGGGSTSVITVNSGATLDATAASGGIILQGSQRLLNNGTTVGPVTANNTSTVGGTGSYTGAVTIAGGSLAPGNNSTSIGTVSLSSLTMTSGNLAVEVGGASSDVVNVSGNANLTGGTLALSLGGTSAPTSLTYDVVTAGSITGTPSSGSGTLGRSTYSIDGTAPANVLRIKFAAKPAANLTFKGTVSGNWDPTLADANWTTTDNGISDTTHYYNGDYVTFNDSNSGQYIVNLLSDVAPSLVIVNNDSGDYLFNGLAIAGGGTLIKNGSRTLTVINANTYTGGTVLNQGTLGIGQTTAIGTGPLTINGGTLDNFSGVPLTLSTNNRQVWAGDFSFGGTNGNLSLGTGPVILNANPTINVAAGTLTVGGPIRDGTGNSITVAGNGILALNGASSYTGTTTVQSGAMVAPGNSFAFGVGGAVTVQSGGAVNVGITANGLNFGQKQFIVAGDGVGGTGALTSSGTTQQNAFQRVALSGDASFGGSGRFDIRSGQTGGLNQAVLNLGGFTLTNNNTNFLGLVGVEVGDGNIITKSGNLDFETTTNIINFGTGKTITIDSNALASFFAYTGTLSRPIIMNGGARLLTNDNTNATVASTITLGGNAIFGALNGNGTATTTLNGVISEASPGVGSITKNANGTGNSTLVLAGNNTFTGGLTISGGPVQLNSAGALNSANPNAVTLNGGGTVIPRLRLNGNSPTVASLTSTGGATATAAVVENNNANTAATLTVDNSTNSIFDGILQNGAAASLGLTTTGTGTLTLSGTSTYTGATTVSGGKLQIGNGGPTGSINGSSGVNGITNLTSPSLLSFNRSDALNFVPPISGVIAVSQDGAATSTVTLSAANTYTGDTNINSGVLSVTGSTSSAGTVNVNSGGILAGNGNGTTTGKVGNVKMFSGAGLRPGTTGADASPGTLTMNTLTVSGGDYRVDIGGDLVNVTGLANFTGPSTISPTGAIASGTYTILSAGNLTLGNTPTVNQIPGARVSFNLLSTPGINGTLKLNVIGNAANLVWKGNANVGGVFPWDVNTTTNWTNTGSNTPDKFFNADNVTFDNTATNKTVNIDIQVLPTTVTVNNSAGNDYTFTGSGGIGGTTGLTKAGGGTLNLNTANSYLGATAIQNGTVVLGNATALGSTSSLTLGSGSTSGVLDLNGNTLTLGSLATGGGTANTIGSSSSSSSLTVAGGSTFQGVIQDAIGTPQGQTVSLGVSSGTLTLTGNNTYTGTTTVSTGATLQVGNGGTTGTLGATAVSVDGGASLIFNRSTPVRFDGTLSGNGSLQTVGTGTLTLTGTNLQTGATTIAAGASLQLGDATVNGGVTGDLGTGAVTDNGTLIINRADGDTTTPATIANAVSGTGGLVQNGAGVVRLTGLNSFTGNVVVNAGTLIAQTTVQDSGATEALGNMQISGRTITVNSGATLQFRINNVYGNQNNPLVTASTANGRTLPTMIINGGTVETGFSTTPRYNQIGNVTLMNGGTISQWGEAGANYSGWQFLGDITVAGTSPSSIITQNGQRNHLGVNTVFNVANVTGNSDDDLLVGAPLRDRSGDYGPTPTPPGIGNLIKTGTGTMLLSALNAPTGISYANSYTGSTAVNQGTLAVGMENGIAAASALILGGGKFDTRGFNQQLAGLTLSATSAIDLGQRVEGSVLGFATSPSWDANSTVSVFNWTGTPGAAGGTDRLVFSAGLTPAQIAQIHFQGFNGATLIGTEVVPTSATTRTRGDWDLNGSVGAGDIKAMLKALTNLASYKSTNSLTTDDLLNIGDVDSSGSITNFDIQAELSLVGGGSLAAVPEPATWLLFAVGAAAIALNRRKIQ